MRRGRGRREYKFAFTDEGRQASIKHYRDAMHAANNRFNDACLQLLREMPADHTKLKSAIRALQKSHHTAQRNRELLSWASAEENLTENRHGIRLRILLNLVRAATDPYNQVARRHQAYVDLALSFVRSEVEGAILILGNLVLGGMMRAEGDEE